MKTNKVIVSVVLTGILSISAQAAPKNFQKDRVSNKYESNHRAVVVNKSNKKKTSNRKASSARKLVNLPRKHSRVTHRGTTYYVARGVTYLPVRGGFVVVRSPW